MIKVALCNPCFKYNHLTLTDLRTVISKGNIYQIISRFMFLTEQHIWTYEYLKAINLFHLYQSYFMQLHAQKSENTQKELLGLEIPLTLNNSGLRHSYKFLCLFTLV